ncbi:MAG: electron transfer flavoprotein subunit alpha/FixB family protein, partial [Duncaniella sp.]|nr:electron transfer flavoprotein subunit alpha/FixB family protein [Duncaniella sp.]
MDQNNLIVYLEFEDGRVADVSLELLTKGRVLASRLGVKLEAVVIGDDLSGVEEQVFPYGVDRLYKVSDERLKHYTSNPHSAVLINLFREIKPQACLMGATCIGRDLGPRVSSCLHSGLTADCTALEIGDHTDPKTGKEYKDLLLQIRPAFGGNIVATIVNPECRPQMATVREGVMKKEIFDPNHKGEVIELDSKKYVSDEDFVVEILDRHIEKSKINIKNSPIIVAGGYGVCSKENFQ